ncbi:16S rRNA (adenine(1518)-N(6)/adenine(1519)-N(6))-dimethyltransferase RsmA [Oscillibacter hominis]|uniref:Ribosomal RNA small subunit methyltransferase A n=1 Tax=Oscillibacter hominis TaxID=2763056 RepID=A0A7G9B750_9FIRM|nr:16S rRNA (adenine(1518)-N(6)/adenine(1519)-N(6))-dimethyltransferase RsmA [Oscillibacter hominis]QNL45381.1 16S rRNA (adenine(1518)-N(6)/adenine(1519)-N(6))-dimethyltransferase RsmA [Oscillibacter hominis]
MNLCDLTTIRALLGRHGFRFSKSMGQNFLIEPSVPRDIAESSGADSSCGVLEIGPGIGPLTVQLARRAGKVAAVELDRTLLPVLEETLAECENVEVISGDVMKMDLRQLASEHLPGLRPMVCANLPYNITTPVLTRIVEAGCFTGLTVMIQREVARRICAAPGSPDYGAFSLFMQYYTEPELLFDVPPACFYPAPKVTSSVLRCRMRQTPAVSPINEAFFFRVARGAFALRRKTLLNSLGSALGSTYSKEALRDAIAACGLPPDIRGERLSLQEMAALSDRLYQSGDR